eukprot:1190442-Prorocentrum_minimum.AAC.8
MMHSQLVTHTTGYRKNGQYVIHVDVCGMRHAYGRHLLDLEAEVCVLLIMRRRSQSRYGLCAPDMRRSAGESFSGSIHLLHPRGPDGRPRRQL